LNRFAGSTIEPIGEQHVEEMEMGVGRSRTRSSGCRREATISTAVELSIISGLAVDTQYIPLSSRIESGNSRVANGCGDGKEGRILRS
jgi:hypothetical protein